MAWAIDNSTPRKGINTAHTDILVHQNQWKRSDAFGHMTDKEVHEYKMTRWQRYLPYYLDSRDTPPVFDDDGGLKDA